MQKSLKTLGYRALYGFNGTISYDGTKADFEKNVAHQLYTDGSNCMIKCTDGTLSFVNE